MALKRQFMCIAWGKWRYAHAHVNGTSWQRSRNLQIQKLDTDAFSTAPDATPISISNAFLDNNIDNDS